MVIHLSGSGISEVAEKMADGMKMASGKSHHVHDLGPTGVITTEIAKATSHPDTAVAAEPDRHIMAGHQVGK